MSLEIIIYKLCNPIIVEAYFLNYRLIRSDVFGQLRIVNVSFGSLRIIYSFKIFD